MSVIIPYYIKYLTIKMVLKMKSVKSQAFFVLVKKILHAISETLRKHPPVPMLNRECSRPYKVPGTDIVLEKGTRVLIPLAPLHHDPRYYPEPHRFDPERFSEEEKQKRHHYAYLPFGEGPRICIGKFHS